MSNYQLMQYVSNLEAFHKELAESSKLIAQDHIPGWVSGEPAILIVTYTNNLWTIGPSPDEIRTDISVKITNDYQAFLYLCKHYLLGCEYELVN